jgi:hypothetical protein
LKSQHCCTSSTVGKARLARKGQQQRHVQVSTRDADHLKLVASLQLHASIEMPMNLVLVRTMARIYSGHGRTSEYCRSSAAPHVAVAAPGEEQEMLVANSTSAAVETARAVVDYIVTAWKLRSTALNGRETNGGDAMV